MPSYPMPTGSDGGKTTTLPPKPKKPRGGRGGRGGTRQTNPTPQPGRTGPAIEPPEAGGTTTPGTTTPEPTTEPTPRISPPTQDAGKADPMVYTPTPHPAEGPIKAETETILAEKDAIAARTDELAAGNRAQQQALGDVQAAQGDKPMDGFAYNPEQREQLGKAGADFRFDLPEDLALKRKRLTDPGFMPGQPPAESTPEEYQGTVDRLNKQFEGKATFKYNPETGGVEGVGNPDAPVYDPATGGTISREKRAAQEKADRLQRARTDLTEARAKNISIGELREQRREIARAEHEAAVAKARGETAGPTTGEGSAAPTFSERVERSTGQYTKALEEGGDVQQAGRSVYRAHRDEKIGPWAEKPAKQDRELFTNHVSGLMSAKGIGAAQAKVIHEALGEVSMADVRYLLKNPTLANANELEELLFMDLYANADGVSPDDIKGLGTLIMESYGVDYKGRRESPKSDEDE